MPSTQDPSALLLEALRALQAGRVEAGAALYRRALAGPGGEEVPVMLHVRLLEGGGRADAAHAVLLEGLRAGHDLSSCRLARGGDPVAAGAEYESLFARGISNATMVAHYMLALSRMGAADRLAEIASPALLFRRTTLPVDGEGQGFLARAAACVEQAGTRQYEEASKSVRGMQRVLKTHQNADRDLRALHQSVRRLIEGYMDDVAASSHLIAPWVRHPFHLHSWGVISEGEGYNIPHTHTGCWVVAVAYLAGDDPASSASGRAGALEIGPPPDGDASCPGWPRETVAPLPGTVVIMPAFYTHWTVPLDGPGRRISVAFNAAHTD